MEGENNNTTGTGGCCLICLNPPPRGFWKEPPASASASSACASWTEFQPLRKEDHCLREQLWVTFLLRKVLGYPREETGALLRNTIGVSPGKWFVLCGECSGLVTTAASLNNQLMELARELERVKGEVRGKLDQSFASVTSYEEVEKEEEEEEEDFGIFNVHQVVRGYFRENANITNPSFTFLSEAHDECQKIIEVDSCDSGNGVIETDPLMPDDPTSKPRSNNKISNSVRRNKEGDKKFRKREFLPPRGRRRRRQPPSDNYRRLATKCSICNHTSKTPLSHANHMKAHELYPADKRCELCGFPCKSQRHLTKHLTAKHEEREKLTPLINAENGKKIYKCRRCDYTNSMPSKVLNHEKVHLYREKVREVGPSRFQCTICNFEETNSIKVERHLKESHSAEIGLNVLMCHLCHRVFVFATHLRKHIRVNHYRKYTYNCDTCGKGFTVRDSYEDHVAKHQNGDKNAIVCGTCGMSFSSRIGLRKHEEKFHNSGNNNNNSSAESSSEPGGKIMTRKRPTKCKHCGLQMLHDKELKAHFRSTHPHLYKYKCELCEAAYMQPGGLQTHKDSKHSETGGKKVVPCPYCGSEFSCFAHVKAHWTKYCRKHPKNNTTTVGVGGLTEPVANSSGGGGGV